jgi:hypothetical protein
LRLPEQLWSSFIATDADDTGRPDHPRSCGSRLRSFPPNGFAASVVAPVPVLVQRPVRDRVPAREVQRPRGSGCPVSAGFCPQAGSPGSQPPGVSIPANCPAFLSTDASDDMRTAGPSAVSPVALDTTPATLVPVAVVQVSFIWRGVRSARLVTAAGSEPKRSQRMRPPPRAATTIRRSRDTSKPADCRTSRRLGHKP